MPAEHPAPSVGPTSLWSYVRPHRARMAVGAALLLLTNALDKAIPWLLQHAVDSLKEGLFGAVATFAAGAMGIAAVMWLVRTASRVAVFNIGRDVEYELRKEVLGQLHRLGPAFFRTMATGDIMSRATNDLGQVRLLVGFGLLNVVNAVFAYGGALGLMIYLSPRLTLYTLAPLPLFTVATMYFGRAMFRRSRDAQEALARLADRGQESILGIRLVRAYALEDHANASFERANQHALRQNMRLVVLRGTIWPVLMALSSVGTIIVLRYGGQMVLDGELTVGQFAAFLAYLGQLAWPTMAFGFILSVVQRGRVAYARVRQILDAEPEVQPPESPQAAGREGRVQVTGLTYGEGDHRILDDVSFEVPSQGSLAIVGRTGSGKSTLAALLPRLLPTPAGRVFLDGRDVTEVDLHGLRDAVGYAQQEPFLFSSSIRQNLGFALDEPNTAEAASRVEWAVSQTAVREEIETLPEGFETVVGERGVQLSGGQKQRVALARALLNDPAVLILDDPLSAVDAKTEAHILRALDQAGAGRTLIVITNRIAVASRADRVLVLDAGRVVEQGTHEELARGDGLYSRLVARQQLEAELESL